MLRVLPGSDFGVSFRCVFRSLFHANASCYLLPATRYCLLPTCYLLLATCYPLTATRFLQCAACDLLLGTCCLLRAIESMTFHAFCSEGRAYQERRGESIHAFCRKFQERCCLQSATGPYYFLLLLATCYLLLATCYSLLRSMVRSHGVGFCI